MYRTLQQSLLDNLDSPQVLILLGPRQVGKTTILKNLLQDKALYIDLDDKVYRDFFDSLSIAKFKSYISSQLGAFQDKKEKVILILDEAQRLKDPGLVAKIFYDEIKDVKIILTGSSSLDIRKKTAESLAGRKATFHLYPLSFQEYLVQKGMISEKQVNPFVFKAYATDADIIDDITKHHIQEELFERMRVGLYPGVLQSNAEDYLHELVEAVILKDIFYLNLIKNTSGLLDLLKLLAYQIGENINVSDISKRLGIARQTVNDYITILEKSYIIFSLHPYRRDRSDEISKYTKIYFYDLGIRNALINDFRPVNMRNDFEHVFRCFVIAELWKMNVYYQKRNIMYYWQTTQGSQLDLVLEKNTHLTGIDISLYSNTFSKGFENTYPESEKYIANLDSFHSFIIT